MPQTYAEEKPYVILSKLKPHVLFVTELDFLNYKKIDQYVFQFMTRIDFEEAFEGLVRKKYIENYFLKDLAKDWEIINNMSDRELYSHVIWSSWQNSLPPRLTQNERTICKYIFIKK